MHIPGIYFKQHWKWSHNFYTTHHRNYEIILWSCTCTINHETMHFRNIKGPSLSPFTNRSLTNSDSGEKVGCRHIHTTHNTNYYYSDICSHLQRKHTITPAKFTSDQDVNRGRNISDTEVGSHPHLNVLLLLGSW